MKEKKFKSSVTSFFKLDSSEKKLKGGVLGRESCVSSKLFWRLEGGHGSALVYELILG